MCRDERMNMLMPDDYIMSVVDTRHVVAVVCGISFKGRVCFSLSR